MSPLWILHFDRYAFRNATTACRGSHVAAVITAINNARPGLVWYAADVRIIGPSFVPEREPTPTIVGDADLTVRAVRQVEQFESGVFVGVPSDCQTPRFRQGGLWTEDEEAADLGDAIVEVRAFDATYVSVASTDDEIRKSLKNSILICSKTKLRRGRRAGVEGARLPVVRIGDEGEQKR
jgi:hypothetical protein